MDFLSSGAFVRAVSTGAVALYHHLGSAQHHLLRLVPSLCCNALGLRNELLARHNPREIRNAPCWRVARSHASTWKLAGCEVSHARQSTHMDIAFKVWTGQGIWFWSVVNPQRNGGTVGAAASEPEAIDEARSSIEEHTRKKG